MLYEEMRLKKSGEVVRVYDITDGIATIFDPSLYQKQNNGWSKVKASQVVPLDFPLNSKDYVSKTKKNKAKPRKKIWVVTSIVRIVLSLLAAKKKLRE